MVRTVKVALIIVTILVLNYACIHTVKSVNQDNHLQPLEIINITPTGEDVLPTRQITFQFNRPVAPVDIIGREASDIPIVINPKLKGQWRWLNATTLALMLEEKDTLLPATSYEITVNTGIKAEDGAILKKAVSHSFITARPRVLITEFKKWELSGAPVMRFMFNMPVTGKSIEENIFITYNRDKKNRVKVIAQPDPDEELWLDGELYIDQNLCTHKEICLDDDLCTEEEICLDEMLWLDEDFSDIFLITNHLSLKDKRKDGLSKGEDDARHIWLISPVKELPPDSRIDYVVKPGLKSFGPEAGIEERVVESIETLPPFEFIGLECRLSEYKPIMVGLKNDLRKCNSDFRASLVFSAPVFENDVFKNLIIEPDFTLGTNYYSFPDQLDIEMLYESFYSREDPYEVLLLEKFDGSKEYRISSKPGEIHDIFGRPLEEPIDISFLTGKPEPAYNYNRSPVILEKNMDTDMFFSVRNIDSLRLIYETDTTQGVERGRSNPISIPAIEDTEAIVSAEVREMLKGQSGVVNGIINTTPDIDYSYNPQMFVAEVTPFHVHAKVGRFNTLVWVTDISTGKAVSDADVKLYHGLYSSIDTEPDVISRGKTDASGVAILDGENNISEIPKRYSRNYRNNFERIKLFVRVEKNDDIALLPIDYNFNIIRFPMKQEPYAPKAWGMTSQSVYKPGDIIQYKIYVRDMNLETYVPAVQKNYDLKVIDPEWKTVFEKKGCKLSEFGAIYGEFTVPESSPVGWYKFRLSNPSAKINLKPIDVLVTNFNSNPFYFTTDTNGEFFETNDEVEVTLKAMLYTGGAYFDSSARISSEIYPQSPRMFFKLDERGLNGFEFNTSDTLRREKPVKVFKKVLDFPDKTGTLVTKIKIPENDILFGELVIESAVKDEYGKYLKSVKSQQYAARDRYVGIRRKSSNLIPKDNPCLLEFITIDRKGKPVSGIPIKINVEFEEWSTRRERGRGNRSIIKYIKEWKPLETRIIKSGEKPVSFIFTPGKSDNYRITGTIKDTKGREHSSQVINSTYYNTEKSDINVSYGNLEITQEKKIYKVGDTALYRVKNPFPGAKALITVEKNGVLKQWIQDFKTEDPVINLKIEKKFIPGFHLSVVVMTPRTAPPPGIGLVDVGRPDFRAGSVKTKVDGVDKILNVAVEAEKILYKPGEKVYVNLEVSSENAKKIEAVELAVVVLNEEVLSFMSKGNNNYDAYKGFYENVDYSVSNYNLLTNLISNLRTDKWPRFAVAASRKDQYMDFTSEEVKVNTEEEAADLPSIQTNIGPSYIPSDQKSTLEELFREVSAVNLRSKIKYMTYWNPSILTDSKGKASIEFEAPEYIGKWWILVLAVTPTDKMGLGEERFTVVGGKQTREKSK